MRRFRNVYLSITILLLATCLTSCYTKRVWYFRDLKDSTSMASKIPVTAFNDPMIQRYDILSINVQTMSNDEITKIFSSSSDASFGINQPGMMMTASGYRVDKAGNVELPIIGLVKVEGLTLDQARDIIKEKAEKYYINPVVRVRFANFHITVLGDVAAPGQKLFSSEKVSILDLLSQSGDLQISARRDNILVVRQEDGYRSFGRIDMNSSDVFKSPYFYLRSGDVVYVEPNRAKIRQAVIDRSNDRFIQYGTTAISIAFSIYTLITLTQK